MPRTLTELTPKEAQFVDQWLIDKNARRAAIAVGYSERSATKLGWELLQKPHIKKAVKAALDAQQKRTQITADRVLMELASVAFLDPRKIFDESGSPKAITSLDDDTARAISGLDVVSFGNADSGVGQIQKVRFADKLSALEKIGKHLGMFRDRVEVTGKDGEPLHPPGRPLADLTTDEIRAALAKLQGSAGG